MPSALEAWGFLPSSPTTSRLTSEDCNLLQQYLSTPFGTLTRRSGRLFALGNGIFTSKGSYELLTRVGDTIIMDIDDGILIAKDVLDSYRHAVLDLRAELKAKGVKIPPLIVVGSTAVRAAGLGRAVGPQAVDQAGFESVFKAKDHYWLSGYDSQESPPLYFLCKLPGPVKTIAEGRESLKPTSVKKAEKAGLIVHRQGDLFAIQSGMTDRRIKEQGGVILRTEELDNHEFREDKKLYGTNHTATFIARLPSGMELACETMRHDPTLSLESRRPDHHDLELGDAWWWVAKNTVPVQKLQKSPRNPFLDRIALESESYAAIRRDLQRDQEFRRLFIEVASQSRRRW